MFLKVSLICELFCCFWSLNICRDKGSIRCNHWLSLWSRVDTILSWFWCMSESGLHVSEFFWNYLITLLYCIFHCSLLSVRFVFSSFVAKAGVKWAQPNCHWVSCYKNFSVSMRQTAPGSLHASSRLELALSLSLSLALCSLLFKSHRYIRKFSVLCVQSFPLPLLLKDVVYLPSDFCHCGTLATATFTLCMERCRLPTVHRSQESQNPLFLLLLHIWSCTEFLISKSSLF